LEPTHIEKIVSAYVSSNDIADFKRIVTNNEVADNDFDLSIQKYVFLNDYEATYIDIDGAISEWTAISKVSSENLDSLIKMLNEYDI
jgi:type I restriction enzyme M protein